MKTFGKLHLEMTAMKPFSFKFRFVSFVLLPKKLKRLLQFSTFPYCGMGNLDAKKRRFFRTLLRTGMNF
jgi:hypothetical protein